MDYGHAEAAVRQGSDPRTYEVTTKRFERDAATGAVTAVVTARVAWKKDAAGRLAMEEVPGSEQVWKADLCLLALGFLGAHRPTPPYYTQITHLL